MGLKWPFGRATERPVAVIQSGDAFENRTRVLPLAVACRAQGWDPVVLVDDRGAASLFALNGVACVAARELPPGEPRAGDDFEIDDLCALELRVREIARRAFAETHWDAVVAATTTLWRMLDALAPAAIFVWNGYTGVWANALRVYKDRHGLPGGFMERGPNPGELFVDGAGVNGRASIARRTGPAMTEGSDRAAADAAGAVEPGDRILFVPLQVQTDSNVLLFSPRVARMRDLAGFAIRLCAALGDGWRVVARPHPEELPGAQLNLPRDPRFAVDDAHPLDHWLERASLCLTINSNVGLQASLRGLPTICLGEGLYCRRSFVVAGQRCEPAKIVAEAGSKALRRSEIAAAAAAFVEELRERSLFWTGQAAGLAERKLDAFGIARRARAPEPTWRRRGDVAVLRPDERYAAMLARLARLRARAGPVVADFDFSVTETQFLTYRRNRVLLTRDGLTRDLRGMLGADAGLGAAHRALGPQGEVLMAHSKREAADAAAYDLVLDEFALPHARTYLTTS